LGARCNNGVVLVADRKTVNAATGDYGFEAKLIPFGKPIIVIYGAAGVQAFYESFRNRVRAKLLRIKEMSWEEFRIVLEESYEDMARIYGRELRSGLSVLIAQRPSITSQLWLISGFGAPQRIKKFAAIGSGEPYGSFYLKRYWNEKLSMIEAADIGYFAIKYIERFGLDNFVGVGDGRPQVWLIPDNRSKKHPSRDYSIRRPSREEILRLESSANRRLTVLKQDLADFWTRPPED